MIEFQSTNPLLDISRLKFPSDAITVKAVRDALNPEGLFDTRKENLFEGLEACVITERQIAQNAFDAALKGLKPNRSGKADLDSALQRREMVTGLDYDYQRFGLSKGARQTVELIRGIEAQAVDQARAFLGTGR